MKAWIVPTIKIGVAAALVTWLVQSGTIDFTAFGELGDRWAWFAAAVGIYALIMGLAALRWRALLLAQDIEYSLAGATRLTLVGLFFNQMMPGSTGGDVIKAYYVVADNKDKRASGIITVFFDRVIGLGVLICIGAAAALIDLDLVRGSELLTSLVWMTWGVVLAMFLGVVVFYTERVRRHPWVLAIARRLPLKSVWLKLEQILYVYKSKWRVVLVSVLLTVALHTAVIAIHFLLFRALNKEPPGWGALFILVPLSQIAMAIPLTPGGLGTAEIAYTKLFELVGTSGGAEVCLLYRLTVYSWALLGGAVYVCSKRRYQPPAEETSSEVCGSESNQPAQVGS